MIFPDIHIQYKVKIERDTLLRQEIEEISTTF